MRPEIRVLLVEDFDIMRAGLRNILCQDAQIIIVGEAANSQSALRLCSQLQPDVILLNTTLPDCAASEVVLALRQQCPHTQIITLGCTYDEPLLQELLQSEVIGCLHRNCSVADILNAIHNAVIGKSSFSPEVIRLMQRMIHQRSDPLVELTRREYEILSLVVMGLTNNEIASRLKLSPFTIKNHISNVFSKLGVSSRVEAVMYALKQGLVQLS